MKAQKCSATKIAECKRPLFKVTVSKKPIQIHCVSKGDFNTKHDKLQHCASITATLPKSWNDHKIPIVRVSFVYKKPLVVPEIRVYSADNRLVEWQKFHQVSSQRSNNAEGVSYTKIPTKYRCVDTAKQDLLLSRVRKPAAMNMTLQDTRTKYPRPVPDFSAHSHLKYSSDSPHDSLPVLKRGNKDANKEDRRNCGTSEKKQRWEKPRSEKQNQRQLLIVGGDQRRKGELKPPLASSVHSRSSRDTRASNEVLQESTKRKKQDGDKNRQSEGRLSKQKEKKEAAVSKSRLSTTGVKTPPSQIIQATVSNNKIIQPVSNNKMGVKASKEFKNRSRSSGNLYTVKKGSDMNHINSENKYKLGGSVPSNLWEVGKHHKLKHHRQSLSYDSDVDQRNWKNRGYLEYQWTQQCAVHPNKPAYYYYPPQAHPPPPPRRFSSGGDISSRSYQNHTYVAVSDNECDNENNAVRRIRRTSNKRSSKQITPPPSDWLPTDSETPSSLKSELPPWPAGSITYPFITKENTFEVAVNRGSHALGLSVTGGCETNEVWPGLIRIKKLFQHQAAWQTGSLRPGDILLKANGIPLTGLSNYEALEVLRTTPCETRLTVCRPPLSIFNAVMTTVQNPTTSDAATSTFSDQVYLPTSQLVDKSTTTSSQQGITYLTPSAVSDVIGEFEITLSKVNGSLGFTLRKEDDSVLGHYVRALIKQPALSDGRIRPGDKILTVNKVDLSPMSHSEAVSYLRQCPEIVTLKLYRDASPTPVSPSSPTEPEKKFKPKPMLRKEAMDMLCDLAVKRNSPSGSPSLISSSKCRTRRLSLENGVLESPGNHRRLLTKQISSDFPSSSCAEKLSQQVSPNNSITATSLRCIREVEKTFSFLEDNLDSVTSVEDDQESMMERQILYRPNFLDLSDGIKKDSYAFVPLSESTSDDALYFNVGASNGNSSLVSSFRNIDMAIVDMSIKSEPAGFLQESSQPFISLRNNPLYQSVDVTGNANATDMHLCNSDDAEDITPTAMSEQDVNTKFSSCQKDKGSHGLLKWKGVVFTPDEDESLGLRESPDGKEDNSVTDQEEEEKILTVDLNRGWSSRLGFSLQGAAGVTYISAIYAESVAARDGRLKVGDQLLQVNGENVEGMEAATVIDIFRKTRGSISISLLRKPAIVPS